MEHEVIHIDQMIDRWRAGEITKEELCEMLQESGVSNPEEAIKTHDAAIRVIQHYAILQQLRQANSDYIERKQTMPETGKLVSMQKYKWIAAAVVVGIIFFSAALYMDTTITNSTLATNLKQDYLVAVVRGNNQFDDIAEAFSSNDLNQVISIYETGRYHSQRDHFLVGYAYMKRGSLPQAISLFKSIEDINADTKEKLYQDEADYYLLLTYLESGKNEEAFHLAQKIHNDRYHTYRLKLDGWKRFQLWWLKP